MSFDYKIYFCQTAIFQHPMANGFGTRLRKLSIVLIAALGIGKAVDLDAAVGAAANQIANL